MGLLTVLVALTLLVSVAALVVVVLGQKKMTGAFGAGSADAGAGTSDSTVLNAGQARLDQQMTTLAQTQGTRLFEMQQLLDARLGNLATQSEQQSVTRLRAEAEARRELQTVLNERLFEMDRQIKSLNEALAKGQDALKDSVRLELDKIRLGNETQLERMRETVDEKLQGTLEKRLGESFSQVSKRLEQVQRGLGEMQTLATDVGGLKRVLSNVKSRGTWGEVLLARQLEDLLVAGQYEENVAIEPGSQERVEFAIRLPGKDSSGPVFMPIDSKFPQESYERLLLAQEEGDAAQILPATKELERALRQQAQTISGKYIKPPHSTDFAIMYLPTEGLFAEAIRIPGLASELQQRERVMITGPTTLMSLLNSLQMGFKTLAIEKRSSEVWQVLASAKEEFARYGQVWDKLGRQLKTAQNTVAEVGTRTRAVERKLRDVETLHIQDPSEEDLLEVTVGAGALELGAARAPRHA